jgi:hypothetical protein
MSTPGCISLHNDYQKGSTIALKFSSWHSILYRFPKTHGMGNDEIEDNMRLREKQT